MIDSFLKLHRIDALQFSISGTIAPASIRDQIVRGTMFVHRARAEGLISAVRPLVIAGAGAGGFAAAITALNSGIKVTMIERNLRPFGRQRKCLSRWLDPTQYDWPAFHWDRGEFPWQDYLPLQEVPLPWTANWANRLAAVWMMEFQRIQLRYGDSLQAHFGTVITQPPTYRFADNKLVVRYSVKSNVGYLSECGALLYARGAGPERVQIDSKPGSYRSRRFWETDSFEKTNLGFKKTEDPTRVLICGSGDGALQDFLRIATGAKSAKQILEKLLPHLDPRLVHRIYTEEDQGYRARVWNGIHWDHNVQLRLERLHRYLSAELLPASGVNIELENGLEQLLGHSQEVELRLIHPCEHFTATYPLNRFLLHLIRRYAEVTEQTNRIDIRPRRGLAMVECLGHSPNACRGSMHKVTLSEETLCKRSATPRLIDVERPFNEVIIRFGPDPGVGPALQINRHTIPYHCAS